MAYSKEQLQQLTTQAEKFWWFQSDAFKSEVNRLQWEWAYDKLTQQLQGQQANLQQKQTTQTAQPVQPTQPAPVAEQPQQQVQQPVQQPQVTQTTPTPIAPEPAQPTTQTTPTKKEPTDFSKIQDVNQWKEQTGWWMNNLESWVENRYWTLAERKDDKLIADINGETFEWKIDNAWNPIKTSLWKTWEIVPDNIKAVNNLQSLLESWASRQEINRFILQNRDFVEDFKPALKNYFKTQDNIDFFNKYSTYNAEELFQAYKEWNIIVWSEKYSLLSEQQRKSFEEYKRLVEKSNTWEAFSYTDINNNTLSLNDVLSEVNTLFSTNIREEYNQKINSPEMETLKNDMTSKAEEIWKLDNTIKNLEDDLRAQYPWISEWRLQALLRRDSKELFRKRDDLVVWYNSLQSRYSMEMDEIKYGIELSKYEDSIKRDNFMTALNIYNTERARMDVQEQRVFEQEQAELSAQRQLAMQKEMVLFNEQVNAHKGWQYIDKWDWNLYYVKDWEVLSAIKWLGKINTATSDDRYDYKFYEWEDWSYTAFTIDKQNNKISQQTFNIKWQQAGWYLATLWNWQITSYGWIHDNWRWLDIDWNIWDPIYTPLGWRVLKVEDYWDKTYGKSVVVQLEDWKQVRFSHLDQFNWLKVWDYTNENITFDKWAILWTVWNTWYVIPWAGWDWSHIDIVVKDTDWKYYNAYQVEDYLKNIWQVEIPQDYYNKNYENLMRKYNSGWLNDTETKTMIKEFWSFEEFWRQANIMSKKIELEAAMPQLDNYRDDLQFLLDQLQQTKWLRNISTLGFDKLQMASWAMWFWSIWAVLDNVKNKTAFAELVRLKENGATFGALSEKEFSNIWNSTEIGKLTGTAGYDTWETALTRLIADVDNARNKILADNPFIEDINKSNIDLLNDNRILDFYNK